MYDFIVTVQPSAEPLQVDAQKLCILHNFAPDILGLFMHYMHENTSRFCKAELLHFIFSGGVDSMTCYTLWFPPNQQVMFEIHETRG